MVRPHPFENGDLYKNYFSDCENIVVDGEGDIFDSINGAKCILHLNCGSSVDGLLADIPSISF